MLQDRPILTVKVKKQNFLRFDRFSISCLLAENERIPANISTKIEAKNNVLVPYTVSNKNFALELWKTTFFVTYL